MKLKPSNLVVSGLRRTLIRLELQKYCNIQYSRYSKNPDTTYSNSDSNQNSHTKLIFFKDFHSENLFIVIKMFDFMNLSLKHYKA